MNRTHYILLAISALILFACKKTVEPTPDTQEGGGPVVLSVVIDSENGAKATLNDNSGSFAFSKDDQIKVYANGVAYTGSTASSSNMGAFTMSEGFPLDQGGLAGFPADIVTGISSSTVTFALPTTYTYSQVGSDNANACKTPVPMVGKYNAPVSGNPMVTLKQAGAVVRFRLTNIKAGSISFTFASNVTGSVTVTPKGPEETQWGDEDGIKGSSLDTPGFVIRVLEVPEVVDGSYIYITLPVPTGTVPDGIIVVNTPDDGSTYTQQDITNGASALNRACGYKIAARPVFVRDPVFMVKDGRYVALAPGNLMAKIDTYDSVNKTATASEWRFQGPFEFVGKGSTTGNYLFYESQSASCEGKWIDMFAWQGEGATVKVHGIVRNTGYTAARYGNSHPVTSYPGCWEVYDSSKDYGEGVSSSDFITISNGGDHKWRMMSATEWTYMLQERTTSTLNDVPNARFARVTIGISNGLLLFPEDIGEKWNTDRMGDFPSSINTTGEYSWGTDTYTPGQYGRMQEVGVMFLPNSGIYYNGFSMDRGYYWTNNSASSGMGEHGWAYRMSVIGNHLYTTAQAHERDIAAAIRLVRDVPAPGTP